MTLKEVEGTFVMRTSKSRTGIIYVPAIMASDSGFPLKDGKVKMSVEGKRLIIEQV